LAEAAALFPKSSRLDMDMSFLAPAAAAASFAADFGST
jgi:hypothetical protein